MPKMHISTYSLAETFDVGPTLEPKSIPPTKAAPSHSRASSTASQSRWPTAEQLGRSADR